MKMQPNSTHLMQSKSTETFPDHVLAFATKLFRELDFYRSMLLWISGKCVTSCTGWSLDVKNV